MNKHKAINEKTGRVYTRNSKTRVYEYAIVEDIYYTNGEVKPAILGGQMEAPQNAVWTSRLDLAQKTAAKMERDIAIWLPRLKDSDNVLRIEVQIIKAEVSN